MTITNPDDGDYIMTFKNPTTGAYVPSEKIAADAPGYKLREKIRFYYRDVVGSDINVTRYDLDVNGTETKVSNGALHSYKYEIEVLKLIKAPTTSQIIIGKVGTAATIAVQTPSEVQLSDPPLSGSF